MPYIPQQDRTEEYTHNESLDTYISSINDIINDHDEEKQDGVLNYVISSIVGNMVVERWGLSYHNINRAIGVLECAKLEMYRRLAANYEDKAIEKNGDIECYGLRSTNSKE